MEFHRYRDVHKRGTIERLQYTTTTEEGSQITKNANIYLPYGYDPEEKYNVLYVIHGGMGHEDAWLDTCQVKNMLDISFLEKRAEPFIVVFPTYYNDDPSAVPPNPASMGKERDRIVFFQKELHQDLIPAVETHYSTYLTEASEEGLKASRNHRAISGFSMGGGTTWNALLMNMDVIATFLPLSGDCWVIEMRGGQTKTVETVARMMEIVKENGFTGDDFRVFAGTGTTDIAYPALTPMIEEMKKHPEMFTFSEDMREGNLHYTVVEGAPHAYEEVYQHLYNYLPVIF